MADTAHGSDDSAPVDPRSPRVRLEAFFDPGSFHPITPEDDRGVLVGVGRVDGAEVVAFATDPTVQGGAMGSDGCRAIISAYDRAFADSCPVVGIWHSGGARLREGVASLDGVGRVFAAMTRISGKVPQISVVLGPEGRIFVTGPEVIRSVTGEQVDMERLGGPDPHGRRSGVVHVVTDSEAEALEEGRRLAHLLGRQGSLDITAIDDPDLGDLLPESSKRAYDVHPLVERFLDEGTMIELHAKWAPNVVVALGRLGGRTVGVVANNPLRLGGCLDSASAEKAARFVRMCDSFAVPLVVLVDVPGYLPGVGQEWDGVVRRGAKLLHAFAECVVPRVTVVTRKAYGGAFVAMNSASLGATRVYAWPGAEVAVMGSVAAVRVLHRRRLAEATDEEARAQLELELAAEHDIISGGIARAVEMGVVDEVVSPDRTRTTVARVLLDTPGVRGAHGNIPL